MSDKLLFNFDAKFHLYLNLKIQCEITKLITTFTFSSSKFFRDKNNSNVRRTY